MPKIDHKPENLSLINDSLMKKFGHSAFAEQVYAPTKKTLIDQVLEQLNQSEAMGRPTPVPSESSKHSLIH